MVCEWVKKERKTEDDWGAGAFWQERQRTVKTSTAVGDKQQPRVLWEQRKRSKGATPVVVTLQGCANMNLRI